MAGLLIKDGEIVTALDRVKGSVYCESGIIKAVGPDVAAPPDAEVIDAAGAYILPGGVDAHVHLELPIGDIESADDFASGTAAAAAGGTTTIIDFISPDRNQSLLAARDLWRRKAEKACVDYGLHMAVTWFSDQVAREMVTAYREDGISSFKTYMAYLDTIGVGDAELLRIMAVAAELGALVTVHAEHGLIVKELQRRLVASGKTAPKYHAASRPAWVEGEAVQRAIALARCTGQSLYIVHNTCREALGAIRAAREEGLVVYAETCPQYLLLDDSVYDKPGFEGAAYVLSPPIRPRGHQEALWHALGCGLVHTIATDHCPFRMADHKVRGRDDFTKIPNGAGGIEDRLRLVYTYGVAAGRISLEQLVDACCTRPAKIFGLYPKKGAIRPGADADLVIYDPRGETVVSAAQQHQRTDRNIYEGLRVAGRVACTVAAGRVVYRDGRLDTRPGAGRYLRRDLPRCG